MGDTFEELHEILVELWLNLSYFNVFDEIWNLLAIMVYIHDKRAF